MHITQELLGHVHAVKGTVTDESKKAGVALAAEIPMSDVSQALTGGRTSLG